MPVNIFAYRTETNNYHFIMGYAQVVSTTQVFLYYDESNTGDHLVRVYYLKV